MVNPDMKGDKGQYFTPRHVIKMCIDVLQPKEEEKILDPACGSGGFLIEALEHVFNRIRKDRDSESEIIDLQKDYAQECVFGMDYDPRIAKVAKAYMIIWGDGRSNIAVCDGLNSHSWSDDVLGRFTVRRSGDKRNVELQKFDIIATNPPFAGDISSVDTLSQYELAYKTTGDGKKKLVNKLSKEKLFIERCINMLVPGGRMAIVLPRGILKNYSDEYVRLFMLKPFTNTKTVVVFMQKRYKPLETEAQISASAKNKIAFCMTEKSGRDSTGKIITDGNGRILSDLPAITEYLQRNVVFQSIEELKKEYEATAGATTAV